MSERVTVLVRVIPRSPVDRIGGTRAGRLVVRVTAPPVDDAANRAASTLLATALGVRAADIRIEQGRASRDKTFSIPTDARAAFKSLLVDGSAAGDTAAGARPEP